jgi:hypothetical protein
MQMANNQPLNNPAEELAEEEFLELSAPKHQNQNPLAKYEKSEGN